MLRKYKRILAFILAMCLVVTTFQSNLGTISVFADDAPETVTEAAPEAPAAEPEPEPESEPEPEPEYVEEYSEPEEVTAPQESAPTEPTPPEETVETPTEEQNIETPTEELPPEEIPVEEEIEEEETEEEELPEEEEEPAQEKEPKMVTVKYRAELGGRVSKSSETIDINDEDAHFEGATASAVNRYYQFTAWVDDEGNPVSSDSTFVPSDIEEDASYIAKFMKLENMPAQDFSGSAGGMDVTVSAGEGIFPEGTEMFVSAISDGEAIMAAQDALGGAVKQAKGVDITFKNAEGEEIEPADSKYVSVSISLSKALEGESFSVVHKDNEGNAEEISAASADGADFRTNSFSIYIIAGVDGEDLERAVETYIFELYDVEDKEWKEVSTQRIKSGETLEDMGIPSLTKNQKFYGWIRQDNKEEVEFGTIETVEATKTIVVRAIIKTTYHVTLIGTDEEVAQVLEAVVENDEEAKVTLNVTANQTSAEEAFEGWKNKAGVVYPYNEEIYASDPDNEVLTASMVSAYWIHFAENDGGSGGGASYTAPIYVTEDNGYKATKPADPTRSGYTFTGWYKDAECTQSFNWNNPLTGNITLYAGWSTGPASFTVIIKKQSINDKANSAEKTYDYEESFVVSNYNAGTTITQGMLSGATGKTYKGFKYLTWEVVNSDAELGNKIAAKGTTVVNVYYDREVVTINFRLTNTWGSDLGPYDNCPQMVGLFGQTLASQNYTWPSERVWKRNNPNGSQTITTFLDAFIPPTGVQGYTITYYSNSTSAGSATIRHYKQDLNGQYTILANQTKGDKDAPFNFTNKYNGFEVVQYSSDGRTWHNTSAGNSTSLTTNLYVRYMRKTYQFDLMKAVEPVDPATGDPTGTTPVLVKGYDTLYEKPFSAMETTVRNEAKNVTAPAGYKVKTDGQGNPILYADPQGKDIFVWGNDRTMPSNNVCVYVVFTKARYRALLDLNVDGDKDIATDTGYDSVTHPNNQSTDFKPYYNAEISRDALMGFEREGYDLVGWFFADGPKEDQPYDYANVTGDVKIYAKWRKTGGVYIKYDANGGTINPDALDGHLYAADSAVVVTAPAYKEDFTFVGWMLLDKDGNEVARYYPNSTFNIIDDYIAPGSDGKSYVTLRADYVPTGLNPDDLHTSFTYHPNGGGGSPVTISEIGEGDARHRLFVNEAVPVWSKADAESNGFVREGYDLIGWNINKAAADAGEVQVGFDGKYVIADNNNNPDNPSANILYAVWKPQVVVHVYIEGAKDTKPYTGSEQQVSGFTVKKIEYKVGGHDYPSGSGFSPSDVKLKEAGLDIAKGTDVDTYYMGLTEESFVSENPNFKKVVFHVTDGELKITPVAVNIKITGNKDSKAYDGEDHTVEGYTATADVAAYDLSKIAFSGTASATRKDKGTTDMGLSAGQFSNTDPNYAATFTVVDGSMTITPIDITVNIKGHFSTDPYDGQEHVVTGYDVEIPGSLYTEDDFTFSGEAKAARTNEGTTLMNLAASQFTNTNENFATVTFNVTDGYQTITKVGDVVVTITGHSDTKDYDGQEHSVSGYDVVISNPLYTEKDFTFSGEDIAKRTIAGTTGMGLKESMFTNNNSNFENVTFVVNDGSMTINPINVTVTITGNTGYADYDGEEHSVTGYEVTNISNPLYTEDYFDFSGNDTAKGTDVATYDMGLAAGQFTNTNENFATVTFNVTDGWIKINPVPVTVNITGHTDKKTYDGQEHEVTGYDVEVVGGLLPEEDIVFTGTDSAKRKDVGTTPMGLESSMFAAENPNFSSVTFNVTDGSIEIAPASATVYIEGNKDSKPYNGSEYTVSGYEVKEITNPLYTENDFTYKGSDSVSGTNAGTYPMGLTQAGFENTNPNFVRVTFIVKDGSLEITPITATVNITGAKGSKPYNGREQSVSGYTVRIDTDLYTEADFTFSGTDEAKGTDAGTYPMGLAAGQFTNTNKNFKDVTFNVTDGEMEITPIDVTVNITGHHDTKTYDGQTHTVSGYDVEILNDLYKGDYFKFTGSAIASRKDEGTTQMGLDASQFENLNTTNFGTVTFNVTDGYMTIVPVDEVVVTITGHSNTVDYNGQEQSVEGYEVEFSNPLYTEKDFTFNGVAKAARTDAGTTDMTMKEADFTNISTNFKKVTFVVNNGYITVNPISVTVTVKGHNDTVTYTGEEQTATGYDLTADNQLYDVTKVKYNGDATAARTDAGTTQMGLDKDLFENTDPNFSNVSFVIEEDGFITVEPLEVTVTVKGNTREEIYNGSEYEVKGYTLEADNELYDANASVTYDGEAVARGTLPGTYDMGLVDTAFGNKDENFNVTFEVTDGFLKITDRPDGEKYTITVTVDDVTKEYTGEVFSGFGYNVAGGKQVKAQEGAAQNIVNFFTGILKPLTAGAADDDAKDPTVTIDGVTYKVMGLSIDQAQRNVGEYPLTVTGTMHIEDLEGHNMDAQFADPVITDGILKITPRIMEVESGSSQKVYDGTPLKNGTVTANRSWGIGDEISYDVTGSQTQVGSSKNTFTVVAGEGTDLKNYEINRIFGTLTVTRRTTPPTPPTPPGDEPTTIIDTPTPTASTPVVATEVPAVLGEQRGRDGAAVLGARRGRTDDPTNAAARYFAIVAAAAAAILLFLTGRKKKEDEEK